MRRSIAILLIGFLLPAVSVLAQAMPDFALLYRHSIIEGDFGVACAFDLYRLDPQTGATQPVVTLDSGIVTAADWSPDGAQIAYFVDTGNTCGFGIPSGDLYVSQADGGDARLLASGVAGGQPVWSPDGTLIAYADMAPVPPQVVVINAADGAEIVRHTGDQFEWSPDSTRLALLRPQPDSDVMFRDLWLGTIDGGEAVQLTDRPGNIEQFDWSPDSSRIVYNYYEISDNLPLYDLFAVNVTSGESVALTNTGDAGRTFALSPDGETIALTTVEGDFYLRRADGTLQQVAENIQQGVRVTPPVWSPDGARVAYEFPASMPNTDTVLWTLHVADLSGTARNLSPSIATEGSLYTWSPDGAQIVFFGRSVDGPPDLYLVSADGSDAPVNLTNTPDIFESSPQWRP